MQEVVDGGCVRAVGLHRDDSEAVPLDEALRDGGAGAVEFRRAVARLAEEDDAAVCETVEEAGCGRHCSGRVSGMGKIC